MREGSLRKVLSTAWGKVLGVLSVLGLFLGLVTGVVELSERVASWGQPQSASRAGCGINLDDAREGEQFLAVALSEPDEDCWKGALGVQPGDEVDAVFYFRNFEKRQVDNLSFQARLSDGAEVVPDSVVWYNASQTNGVPAPNVDIVNEGINVGSYGRGANAWVRFKVRVSRSADLPCGLTALGLYGRLISAGEVENPWRGAAMVSDRRC